MLHVAIGRISDPGTGAGIGLALAVRMNIATTIINSVKEEERMFCCGTVEGS
jgi:hypothetical protein